MAIKVLSEAVIDQIAAGEVLERPSHLVKELVENAIDAGATEIEVEFDEGGRRVRIQDNGSGMSREDLALSIRRHATSKISESKDLYALASFGFRGEALASIAAVSHLTISSCEKGQKIGHVFKTEFGAPTEIIERAMSHGTMITVENLFANVPARLKFLKSETAESSQIKQVLRAIALAHPELQFRVRTKGVLLYFWQARPDWKLRAEEVLDYKPLYAASGTENEVEVKALLGSPDQTLHQNRGVWLFVQGRWIQDRALNVAIMESYRNLLMHGEYPQVALSLTVPKDFVDVNVHPTKSQVKFVEPQRVFRAVVHVLREALEKAPWIGSKESGKMCLTMPEMPAPTMQFQDQTFATVQYQKKVFPVAEVKEALRTYAEPRAPEMRPASSEGRQVFWSTMEILGQAQQTYIIAQSKDVLYLVDQHAAHERIVFERLMQQWKAGKFDAQPYLLPLVIDLQPHEMEALEQNFEHLETMGLVLEKMGPESLAISSRPIFVSETGIVHALQNLATEISMNGGSFAWEKKMGDIFASMACHSVVRAGETLSVEEMKNILVQMDEFPLSTFCPHGRPVSVNWSFNELERKFGRIV
jgi:DNA mismatch repair protein MutL